MYRETCCTWVYTQRVGVILDGHYLGFLRYSTKETCADDIIMLSSVVCVHARMCLPFTCLSYSILPCYYGSPMRASRAVHSHFSVRLVTFLACLVLAVVRLGDILACCNDVYINFCQLNE